jgi:hypothetical protein
VVEGNTVRFQTTSINAAVRQVVSLLDAHAIEITELHVQKASLEDVFLELTGARLE